MSAYLGSWTLIMAVLGGAALLIICACVKPAGATSDSGEHSGTALATSRASPSTSDSPLSQVADCAQDVTGNHIIDTADLTAFTGAFGTATPHLDIFPDPPNGYVDTGDITAVTAHFGEKCYGFSGSEPISVNPFGQVTDCAFKAEGWWKSTQGGWAIIQPMAGLTGCYVGFDSVYWAVCSLQIEAFNGAWYVVDGTQGNGTGWMVNGVLRCSAENHSAVGVPMYTALREKMCHAIWRDGSLVHGFHCHTSPTEFFLPCNPQDPSSC